ncbi:MAG: hypothetical protein EOM55_03400 [Clostridia bacterium]|nr:hypothetical protein [Clostridia bacterium]
MKKFISTRQLTMVLILSMIGLKVLVFPNLISQELGRDSYIFVFFMMSLDFAVLLTFLFLKSKFKDMTYNELLEYLFGKFVSKIIMFCFFAYFLNRCCAIFETNFVYLNENLYTNFNWFSFSMPILVVIVLVSLQGVNAFARTCEIFVPLIILGFIVSIIIGSVQTDFTNLLPFMEKGALQDVFKFDFWFGDYLIFMVFFGDLKVEKRTNLKICTGVIISILLATSVIAVFYAKFNNSVVCHSNAISDLIQASPSMSDIGSFDWILILIWDMVLFLLLSLNILGAYYTVRQILSKINPVIALLVIALIVFAIVYFNNFDIFFAIDFNLKYFKYPLLFIQYVIPALIFIVALFRRRKKDEVSVEK